MALTVVLHSGGLDSTVCLLLAKEARHDVVSLGVDYGQRHRVELEFAARQCERFGVKRVIVSMNWDKPVREIPVDRELIEIRSGVSKAFLPGRNILFLSIGFAEAAGLGASELHIGVNSVDFSGYPDCRPEFVAAFQRMVALGAPGGPAIRAPLQNMAKPEIASEAFRLGLTKADTWSCYTPDLSASGPTPCGRCDACKLHDFAWKDVLDPDRTESG